MNPYMFVINAIPQSNNKEHEDLAGAKVHIWVISDDRETAKIRAIDYITKYHWEVTSVEYELLIQPEQIPNLHNNEALLYKKALQYGISADFVAYPKA